MHRFDYTYKNFDVQDFNMSTKGASKQRRDLINGEITRLRDLLPLSESSRTRLGQLQTMSMTCIFIRKCNYLARLFGGLGYDLDTPFEFTQALTGFLLVVTRDGKLLYISDNVTEYLGHSMVDLLTQGDSIYDIVDKRDHPTIQTQMTENSNTHRSTNQECSFFCRMNISRALRRQCGYGDHKMMYVKGRFISPAASDRLGRDPVLVATCCPVMTPDVKETNILSSTMAFQSVHGLDMKYIEVAANGEHHLGYSTDEIQGKSWYSLLHPDDVTEASQKHMQLVTSSHEAGCALTLRLMTRGGDWIWCNVIMHIKQPFSADNNPAIVCTNQVISASDGPRFKKQNQLLSSHIARSPELIKPTQDNSHAHNIKQVMLNSDHANSSSYQSPQRGVDMHSGSFSISVVENKVAPDSMFYIPSNNQQQFVPENSSYTLKEGGPIADANNSTKQQVIRQLKRKLAISSTESMSNVDADDGINFKSAKIPRTVADLSVVNDGVKEDKFTTPKPKLQTKPVSVGVDSKEELLAATMYDIFTPNFLNISGKNDPYPLDILEDQVFSESDVSGIEIFNADLSVPSEKMKPCVPENKISHHCTTELSLKMADDFAKIPISVLTPESSPVGADYTRSVTPDQTVPITSNTCIYPDSPESLKSPFSPQLTANEIDQPARIPFDTNFQVKNKKEILLPELDTQYIDNFFDDVFQLTPPHFKTNFDFDVEKLISLTASGSGSTKDLEAVSQVSQPIESGFEGFDLGANETQAIMTEDQLMKLVTTVKEIWPDDLSETPETEDDKVEADAFLPSQGHLQRQPSLGISAEFLFFNADTDMKTDFLNPDNQFKLSNLTGEVQTPSFDQCNL